MACKSGNLRTRVEIVTMRATSAARARSITWSSSLANSGKSRCAWLSTSMLLRFALDVAREHRARRRQRRAGLEPALLAEERKRACLCRNREEIEKLFGPGRNERLRQDRHLARHLGRGPQHTRLTHGVRLGELPRRGCRKIAVRLGDQRPHPREH